MTRFIIKVAAKPTPKNECFNNQVYTHYYGKKQKLLGTNVFPNNYYINEYSYTTKSAAVKGLKIHKELCEFETFGGYWNSDCELVEVEM